MHPDAQLLLTMKAHGNVTAQIECLLTRIFLKNAPSRWKRCMDMVMKLSGLMQLGGLFVKVVLFSAYCNYAFRYIWYKMMRVIELEGVLAPELYGSKKKHKAIDLQSIRY